MNKQKTKKKITKNTPIKKLLEEHPEVAEILMAYGLNCVGCVFSKHDTLESGARLHGLDGEINLILKDINQFVNKDL